MARFSRPPCWPTPPRGWWSARSARQRRRRRRSRPCCRTPSQRLGPPGAARDSQHDRLRARRLSGGDGLLPAGGQDAEPPASGHRGATAPDAFGPRARDQAATPAPFRARQGGGRRQHPERRGGEREARDRSRGREAVRQRRRGPAPRRGCRRRARRAHATPPARRVASGGAPVRDRPARRRAVLGPGRRRSGRRLDARLRG